MNQKQVSLQKANKISWNLLVTRKFFLECFWWNTGCVEFSCKLYFVFKLSKKQIVAIQTSSKKSFKSRINSHWIVVISSDSMIYWWNCRTSLCSCFICRRIHAKDSGYCLLWKPQFLEAICIDEKNRHAGWFRKRASCSCFEFWMIFLC